MADEEAEVQREMFTGPHPFPHTRRLARTWGLVVTITETNRGLGTEAAWRTARPAGRIWPLSVMERLAAKGGFTLLNGGGSQKNAVP